MTGTITLRYDSDDRYQRAEVAAIVRGDTERLRRVSRGKEEPPGLSEIGADVVHAWLDDELDGLPLSLEE